MPVHISPNYTDEKLDDPSVDDLIDVFGDRVKGWIIEPSKSLMETPIGIFPGIGLLLTYFEGFWSYKTGEDSTNKSKQFFGKAFVDVFKHSKLEERLLLHVTNVFYEDARCGFFHDGLMRDRICFAAHKQGELLITLPKKDGIINIDGEIQSIVINADRFLKAIEKHFDAFISMLRNTSNQGCRECFEQYCRSKWGIGKDGRVIGLPDPSSLFAT